MNSKPLTVAEVDLFLENLPQRVDCRSRDVFVTGSTLRDLYRVWFRTGWRSNEIVAVRSDWLSFTRQTVELRAGRAPRAGGIEATPKTGQREVDCSYAPEIFAAFERRRKKSLSTGHREHVFTDSRGRPLS
jgi:hypothetical protein